MPLRMLAFTLEVGWRAHCKGKCLYFLEFNFKVKSAENVVRFFKVMFYLCMKHMSIALYCAVEVCKANNIGVYKVK